jgi:hypothetical protein
VTPGRHAADGGDPAASDDSLAAEIMVRGGNPTAAEAAAVVAVVAAALDDLRAEGEVLPTSAPSAWERSRRGLRAPLDHGSWRGFTGQR